MNSGERCLKRKEIEEVEVEVLKPRKAVTMGRKGFGVKDSPSILDSGTGGLKTNLDNAIYRKMTAF